MMDAKYEAFRQYLYRIHASGDPDANAAVEALWMLYRFLADSAYESLGGADH